MNVSAYNSTVNAMPPLSELRDVTLSPGSEAFCRFKGKIARVKKGMPTMLFQFLDSGQDTTAV